MQVKKNIHQKKLKNISLTRKLVLEMQMQNQFETLRPSPWESFFIFSWESKLQKNYRVE